MHTLYRLACQPCCPAASSSKLSLHAAFSPGCVKVFGLLSQADREKAAAEEAAQRAAEEESARMAAEAEAEAAAAAEVRCPNSMTCTGLPWVSTRIHSGPEQVFPSPA